MKTPEFLITVQQSLDKVRKHLDTCTQEEKDCYLIHALRLSGLIDEITEMVIVDRGNKLGRDLTPSEILEVFQERGAIMNGEDSPRKKEAIQNLLKDKN
jgi:hypothetical protein